MKSVFSIFFLLIVMSTSSWAQNEEIKDFTLSDDERKEIEKIEKIKEEFKKKYPDWVDTSDEGTFIDYRLGKSIDTRKKEYIKRQRELLKRLKEEEEKQAIQKKEKEKEAKRLEKLKKEEDAAKKKAEEERLKAEAIKNNPLNIAMGLLKDKRYKEAYDKFYLLFLEDTSSPRINFYLGLSASGGKMYEEALSAFERVLIVEPAHTRARLELARVYFFLKMFPEAEAEFQKVLASGDLPPEVLANIEKFMVAIEKTKVRNHFNAAAMVGLQYDTNINNDIGENNYVIDRNTLSYAPDGIKGENPKTDAIHQEMANLNHVYDFGKMGDYYMQNSFTLFAQNYTANPENNILFYSVSTGVEQKTKALDVLTRLHYDTIQIDSQNYMTVAGIELGAATPLSTTIRGIVRMKSQQKTFDANPDNDSAYNEMFFRVIKSIEGTKDNVSARVLYADEKAKDSPTTDRGMLGLRVGYQSELNKKNTLTSTLAHRFISYNNETIDQKYEMKKRVDGQTNLTVIHAYKLDKTILLNGSFSYIDNASSHNAFTYNKMLVGVNMLVLF